MLRSTRRAVAASGLVALLLGGCSTDDDQTTPEPQAQTEATTTSSSTTVNSSTSTTETPTPPTNPPKPDICEPDMGTTLQAQYRYPPYPSFPDPPPDWEPPDPDQFDWDGDGTPDTLTVADDTVTVDWGTGSITITNIQTDFVSRSAVDDDGIEWIFLDEQLAAQHTPAAVGDVTGDGHPDLIVTHGGHTAVLIGQGPNTPTQTLTFNDVGHTTPGWRSPPIRPPPASGQTAEGVRLVPRPGSNIDILWDTNRDSANDFLVVRHFERAGPSRTYFGGVQCVLPAP